MLPLGSHCRVCVCVCGVLYCVYTQSVCIYRALFLKADPQIVETGPKTVLASVAIPGLPPPSHSFMSLHEFAETRWAFSLRFALLEIWNILAVLCFSMAACHRPPLFHSRLYSQLN